METISTENPLPEGKEKKENLFFFLLKKISLLLHGIEIIRFKELKKRIQQANFYGFFREHFIRFYIKRAAAVNAKDLIIAWQPLHFIIFKLALLCGISYLLYSQFPLLSAWLDQGFAFFRLQDIYNFQYPQRAFFDTAAKGIIIFVIGYYSIYFIYYQIQSLFSSAILTVKQNKLLYIRNFLIKKELFIFSLTDIDYIVLKQNILYRIFSVGTILVRNHAGDIITIRSIKYASQIVRKIMKNQSPQKKKQNKNIVRESINHYEY